MISKTVQLHVGQQICCKLVLFNAHVNACLKRKILIHHLTHIHQTLTTLSHPLRYLKHNIYTKKWIDHDTPNQRKVEKVSNHFMPNWIFVPQGTQCLRRFPDKGPVPRDPRSQSRHSRSRSNSRPQLTAYCWFLPSNHCPKT